MKAGDKWRNFVNALQGADGRNTEISINTVTKIVLEMEEELKAAERQEMKGFNVSVEELLDDDLRWELAIDNTSNVQGAFARICSLLQKQHEQLKER